MSAQKFLRFQCHEFDGHFHLVRDGLKPYYQPTNVRKNHDWSADGKPTGTFEAGGETWRVCLDYDDQPIVPWRDPQYRLETAYLYRIYFVCEDSTYDDERADRSQRVKGGTITFRPRWPDMKRQEKADDDGDGEWNCPITDVDGYMDLGVPYVDAQVQGSNIDFDRYPQLLAEAAAAFGIPRRYFHEFHRTSNVTDAAVYVRPMRSESGPIYAADGPIARMHSLLESDRSGYRKHVEDNRERPGDYVTTVVDDGRAGKVIWSHEIGKEAKHYYMKDPDNYDPDEFGWYPRLEIGYQTSVTDSTVYWDRDDDELDRHDLRRELEELLVNVLDWGGFDVTGGGQYQKDAYFKPDDRERRSLKLVDCPLPEIESDYAAQTMLKRVRSAEEQFRRSIGSTAMQVADDAQGVETDAFERFVRNYDVGIDERLDDCRALLKPRYVAADREDAKNLAREAYTVVCDRHGSAYGFHMRVELADGSVVRFRDLNQRWAGADWDRDAHRRKRERQLEEQADADGRDIDPEEIDIEAAWDQFADRDEWVTYSTLKVIVSSVTDEVDQALEALQEHGEIVTEQGRGFGLARR
ncbi:hypothetical protein C488_15707 [Natrinema pellirubrum DSM 15624]|uniref:DUF7845 domain-containing protein n=1 Tax=Natrinema pellirubrum (strain DSM 15624 / CIP 106293 / JCM 10476 / NCIMB 786 / 157) TaxID=797303 RepID=L0JQG0_NATP1|nr:hypothetical protein [Natrinema pellirubrum]AGB33760.1 hypothetical protein Natpe_4032 [Natrinema pellirubrum DSM 15624]ELY71982.1 hypothetical protein C488_15707 [Natrinema pellirubrum DSM 15624]